jgi:hypothetical protein
MKRLTIEVTDQLHRALKLRAIEESTDVSKLARGYLYAAVGDEILETSVETPDPIPRKRAPGAVYREGRKEGFTEEAYAASDPSWSMPEDKGSTTIESAVPKQSVHEILAKVNRGKK